MHTHTHALCFYTEQTGANKNLTCTVTVEMSKFIGYLSKGHN